MSDAPKCKATCTARTVKAPKGWCCAGCRISLVAGARVLGVYSAGTCYLCAVCAFWVKP